MCVKLKFKQTYKHIGFRHEVLWPHIILDSLYSDILDLPQQWKVKIPYKQ